MVGLFAERESRAFSLSRALLFPSPSLRPLLHLRQFFPNHSLPSLIQMAATSSAYPPPPPFYRLYKDYLQNPSSAPEPPPPIEGTYMLYGSNYTTDDVLPSLEDQGVRQLYPKDPNIDYKKELRKLNRELQLHILELADVLIERPSQYARRVEEISVIFKNLHHLLNSLRPHQARATLIHILEMQIQQRKKAVDDIKRRRAEAQQILKESLEILGGRKT